MSEPAENGLSRPGSGIAADAGKGQNAFAAGTGRGNGRREQGRHEGGTGGRQRRPSLREDIADLDRTIVRLLVKRNNMLGKIKDEKGRINPAEEKYLRENWEGAIARVSRDHVLSSRMFTILQTCTFMPRPAGPQEDDGAPVPGIERRTAFNLAPSALPVRLRMNAPLDSRASRAWMMLAAASGQAIQLEPCLMNDAIVDCLKAINQLGEPGMVPPGLNRTGDCISVHPAPPIGAPDKVLHMGDSAWNFWLLLGQYLGRPSRAMFSGAGGMRLADLSVVRHFLPSLGARLVHLTPKSDGLPVRLECSGMLPQTVAIPPDIPTGFVEGLLLAAPFYGDSLSLDVTGHPGLATIQVRTLPILRAAGAAVDFDGGCFRVTPGPLNLPARPDLDMEPELAMFLLALPLALGGQVELLGRWPETREDAGAIRDILRALGLRLSTGEGATPALTASGQAMGEARLDRLGADVWEKLPANWQSLPLALATCAALRGGDAVLPRPLLDSLDDGSGVAAGFCHAAGVGLDGQRLVPRQPDRQDSDGDRSGGNPIWNAPDPLWALALAVAACARPTGSQGLRLGNPGIVTELFPAFWALYNNLPEPPANRETPAEQGEPQRRRIRTRVMADLPEPRSDQQ